MQNLINFITQQYFVRRGEDGSYDIFTTRTGTTRATVQLLRRAYEEANPVESESCTIADYRSCLEGAITAQEERDASELEERRRRFHNTEEEYILQTLKDHGIDSNRRLDSFKRDMSEGDAKDYPLDKIEDLLKAKLPAYNRTVERPFPTFGKEDVIAVFRNMLHEGSNIYENELRKELMFDENFEAFTDAWVEQVLKVMCCETDMAAAKMAFKHMMWQVKRRMYSKGVSNDLWVAFFGADQGKGKSYCIKNLIFKPMNEFICNTKLTAIDDMEREVKKFSDNFIINFEELAMGRSEYSDDKQGKVNEKSLANLKSLLTEDEIKVRKYHSQDQMSVRKSFVPVSTANKHLYDVIFDETGMRRYFEIELGTPEGGGTFDKVTVAKLAEQAENAWRGINENSDLPVWDWQSKTGRKISEIQASYKPATNVDEFIDTCDIVKSDTNTMSVTQAFSLYKQFCIDCGYRQKNMANFRKEMSERFEVVAKRNSSYFKIEKFVETKPEAEEML